MDNVSGLLLKSNINLIQMYFRISNQSLLRLCGVSCAEFESISIGLESPQKLIQGLSNKLNINPHWVITGKSGMFYK